MPKEAARLFLKVTNVRVERIQEMELQEFKSEGALRKCNSCPHFSEFCGGSVDIAINCHLSSPKEAELEFKQLWDSTVKKPDIDRYGWEANPWVWVVEFERVEKES
jgi:hypothetical protein